jgi:DNA-binding response OmpR family regulator
MDQHLRVSELPPEVTLRWGDFTLKLEAGAFAFQGQDVGMTAVESAILYLLMRHAGELMGHALIAQAVFRKPRSQSNFVPVHISRIRTKLRAARSAIFIENIRGEGYVLFWSRSSGRSGVPGLEVLDSR